jgi:hypothetical protein
MKSHQINRRKTMEFDFEKLLLPLAGSMVGLIPVLINITVNWADRKSKTARLNVFLQQNNLRIGFLQTWFNLQKEVSSPDKMVQIKGVLSDELQELYETFMDALLDSDELNRRQETINRYRNTTPLKRSLLIYQPYNTKGWFFHTLFYMSILPLVVGAGYVLFQYTQTRVWMESIPQEYMYAGVALLALLLIFRSLGRMAAREVEGRLATVARKTAPLHATGD